MVRLHELAIEDWDRVMAINLRGMFLCMRAVLPVMLKQKRGSIISTASISGIMAGGGNGLDRMPMHTVRLKRALLI